MRTILYVRNSMKNYVIYVYVCTYVICVIVISQNSFGKAESVLCML